MYGCCGFTAPNLLALVQFLWLSAGNPVAGFGSSLAIWLADDGDRPAQ
jgi:hypothetical protein